MLDCQSFDDLITPYIDGELADADRRAVDEHLRRCAACHSRAAAERAVHDLCRARHASLESPRAPDALRAACRRIADSSAATTSAAPGGQAPLVRLEPRQAARGRRLVGALTPFALAASLVVILGGAFLYQATDRSARVMAAELAADHVRCFAMNRVLGTQQSAIAVESSMLSGFDWRAHLPEDPALEHLELVGARPCLYGKGKVAHIMYRHDGNPVSLFMLPGTARAREFVEVLGHEAAIWCVNDRTFVLVAREPKPEVERLASFVQARLR
jgi:anti-sigma factor RsiW